MRPRASVSVCRSRAAIVLAHGGELSLHDRQPHGLIVRIELPVRQQSRQSAA